MQRIQVTQPVEAKYPTTLSPLQQECLSPEEIEAAIHTDSKHADRLRSIYASKETDELGYVAMGRSEFLGSRRQFEGLKRVSQEPTGHIYDLWLGS